MTIWGKLFVGGAVVLLLLSWYCAMWIGHEAGRNGLLAVERQNDSLRMVSPVKVTRVEQSVYNIYIVEPYIKGGKVRYDTVPVSLIDSCRADHEKRKEASGQLRKVR